MRTFVMGDIHGAYRALIQCLERAQLDYDRDRLIVLGDVCDGWPETRASIDELMKIKNLVYLLGNHDHMALDWMKHGVRHPHWVLQGGDATLTSYGEQVDDGHRIFLEHALPYYVFNNKLFVHGGFKPGIPIEQQEPEELIWNRDLARIALDFYMKGIDTPLTNYDEVYLGHTPIPYSRPLFSCGIWLMDTGAGWSGVLSMMNIESKEIFTSDPVPSLYPGVEGRRKLFV
jgi:serine/threonine protein phosphatase 1